LLQTPNKTSRENVSDNNHGQPPKRYILTKEMKQFNLIFLKDGLLLSSKEYGSWAEIQDEYENYMASVDFDSLENIKEYIVMDYKLERIFVETMINKFIESKLTAMSLEF
jgi:hypothetical protein